MGQKLWTQDELILALHLYLELPFGQIHHKNEKIIRLAKKIERSPSAVAMRLSNFASVDPVLQSRGIVGLTGGKNQVQPIWDTFAENKNLLNQEVERIEKKC